jgi:hypothetical protein
MYLLFLLLLLLLLLQMFSTVWLLALGQMDAQGMHTTH